MRSLGEAATGMDVQKSLGQAVFVLHLID